MCGILIDESDLHFLEPLRAKNDFEPKGTHVIDPFDLTVINSEIEKFQPFIKNKKILQFPSKDSKRIMMKPEEINSAFTKMMDTLVHSDSRILPSHIKEVRLREQLETNSTVSPPDLKSTNVRITDYFETNTFKICIEKESRFSKIMELARLISWNEYLAERRKSRIFIEDYLKNQNNLQISQFVKLSWPNIRLETYVDSQYVLPDVLVKKNHITRIIPLRIGNRISMVPIAKSCVGKINSEGELVDCLKSKDIRFGTLLSYTSIEDRCDKCRTAIDRIKFGKTAIKKLEDEGEVDPLAGLNDALHYVYITRFANTIKVGRSRLTRGVSRLIEQGCLDAVVIHPILTYDEADKIEDDIYQHLKDNVDSLKSYEIHAVSKRGSVDDKLLMIKEWVTNKNFSNISLYHEIIRLIGENNLLVPLLYATNQNVIECKNTWRIDQSVEINKIVKLEPFWNRIEGEIKGIIGSFLFFEKSFIDLRNIQGWIFTGAGFD